MLHKCKIELANSIRVLRLKWRRGLVGFHGRSVLGKQSKYQILFCTKTRHWQMQVEGTFLCNTRLKSVIFHKHGRMEKRKKAAGMNGVRSFPHCAWARAAIVKFQHRFGNFKYCVGIKTVSSVLYLYTLAKNTFKTFVKAIKIEGFCFLYIMWIYFQF